MTEALNKEQIISRLQELVTSKQIDLDADHLKKASEDFYRKYPQAHQIYTAARPVAIVYPNNTAEVARILKYANEQGINVIARTGNSSIERGLESAREPHIIVDGSHLNKIVQLDVENQQLTAQAGLPLVIAEKYLNDKHLTTGHLPQSQPLADFGGLVATRSIGQLSTYYGGIEDLLVGLEAVMADGTIIRIKNEPRRSVGPDLRHLFLGSEGALAFITEVTVKVFPYWPQNYHYLAYNVATMRAGFQILRQVMVNGYKPSIIRLYDPVDWSQYFPENKQPIL
ncbi:MAG: FAD-binding oxidoreductase, partial [Bombilactobacillus sp.]|nr:FAD-binding oxidoreductase [Bombilactobacillus sp.]